MLRHHHRSMQIWTLTRSAPNPQQQLLPLDLPRTHQFLHLQGIPEFQRTNPALHSTFTHLFPHLQGVSSIFFIHPYISSLLFFLVVLFGQKFEPYPNKVNRKTRGLSKVFSGLCVQTTPVFPFEAGVWKVG